MWSSIILKTDCLLNYTYAYTSIQSQISRILQKIMITMMKMIITTDQQRYFFCINATKLRINYKIAHASWYQRAKNVNLHLS